MNRKKVFTLFTGTLFSLSLVTGCGTASLEGITDVLNLAAEKGLITLESGEGTSTPEQSAKKPAPSQNGANTLNRPVPPERPDRNREKPQPPVSEAPDSAAAQYTVILTGGYETVSVDKGRPVVLIASALGVPEGVFREAFSYVTPAAGGQEPDPDQVRRNKESLMNVLAPYGITNEKLDMVSNYYRYNQRAGEVWNRVPAKIEAVVKDGVVTGFNIINSGSGYTSVPTVTVSGVEGLSATATITFTEDFKTNGSITGITISK